MDALLLHAKRAGLMWLTGFREACCFHRVILFCIRSRALLIKTGLCFLLNGFIFLGSLSVLNSFVIPILSWILPSQCKQLDSLLCDHKVAMSFYSCLRFLLIILFYVFWFCPLCVVCYVLSKSWHADMAEHAYDVVRRELSLEKVPHKNDDSNTQNPVQMGRPGGFEGVLLGIGEKVYSILLLSIFWLEIFATGYIPYIGQSVSFLLYSWMYAYYFFEYKWDYSELSFDERLDFFESNWAFFAGFGTPCVLATFFFPLLENLAVFAICFPLFVMTAARTNAEQVVDSLRRSWGGPGKCKIFFVANNSSTMVVQFFRKVAKNSDTRSQGQPDYKAG